MIGAGHRLTAWCLLLGLFLFPAVAAAQRIVLLRPKGGEPVILQAFGRLQGELTVHDFEVVVADAKSEASSPADLAREAERFGAVAAVSFARSEGAASVDIWISDRVTGKTSMRTIAAARQPEAASILAIRAVDLLRTSLREFGPTEAPPSDVVGAHPDRAPERVKTWAAPPAKPLQWSLETGAAVQTTLSNVGVSYGPWAALSWHPPSGGYALRVAFQGPLSGAQVTEGDASATVHDLQAFGGFGCRLASVGGLSLEADAAVGAHRLDVQGSAAPPYLGRSDSTWSALLGAGLGVRWQFASAVALAGAGRAVVLLPRPVVVVAERSYPYARPAWQATAALAVSF